MGHIIGDHTNLIETYREAVRSSLFGQGDLAALRAVSAHFAHHMDRVEEKGLKEQVKNLLATRTQLTDAERESIAERYADTRIREMDRQVRSGNAIASFRAGGPFALTPAGPAKGGFLEFWIRAELRKTDTGADIYAIGTNGETVKAGALVEEDTISERDLFWSPMTVDKCNAILVIIDFTDGELANYSHYVIVDTDAMTGDTESVL